MYDGCCFQGFILSCIMLNTVVLLGEYYMMPSVLADTIYYCNTSFSAIFVCEVFTITLK